MIEKKLQIESSLIASGSLDVANPYNHEIIARVETAGKGHLEELLSAALARYKDKRQWLSRIERLEILERLTILIKSKLNELTELATLEGGKPYKDSKIEILRAIDGCKVAVEHLKNSQGKWVPMGFNAASANKVAFTQKEPIGVVVAISAFNHPFNLVIHQVVTAIAAGCPVIVKPAEKTPLSSFALSDLLLKAGLPKGWCQVVVSDSHETTATLIQEPRVAFMSFIGSAKVGWMLKSQLAAGTRCALEHGGVAPALVYHDADLQKAAKDLTKSGFYHAGQVCVSTQKIYVETVVFDKFVALLQEQTRALSTGDPLDPNTDIGPIISQSELKRIESWVDDAVKNGAVLACGGERIGETCYAPTILLNPLETDKVSTREFFAPVLCVYATDNMEQTIEHLNQSNYAFQAAVYTQSIDTAFYVRDNLDASAVMVNEHTAFRVDAMPFAGLKQSGYGVGGIGFSIDDMQVDKLMVIKSQQING